MLNPYGHEHADVLAGNVEPTVPALARLIEAADEVELVYVNDNYEEWSFGREALVGKALEGRHPELVEPITPKDAVPFLAKGRHSIFYETSLDHLLKTNDVERIVLSGQVTEQCILYSALDAYLRAYEIAVPHDAVAHIDEELAKAALAMMERNMHAELTPAADAAL